MTDQLLATLLHLRWAMGYTYRQCQEMTGIPKHTIRRRVLPFQHHYNPNALAERAKLKRNARFWTSINITADPDECWEWQKSRYPAPRHYGEIGIAITATPTTTVTIRYAHIAAFALHHQKLPEHWVLHHCDNPPCCNPNHLYDGTPKDNTRDREKRGRGNRHRAHLIVYQGIARTSKEWAEYLTITHTALRSRLDRGWCIDCAMTMPRQTGRTSPCVHKQNTLKS